MAGGHGTSDSCRFQMCMNCIELLLTFSFEILLVSFGLLRAIGTFVPIVVYVSYITANGLFRSLQRRSARIHFLQAEENSPEIRGLISTHVAGHGTLGLCNPRGRQSDVNLQQLRGVYGTLRRHSRAGRYNGDATQGAIRTKKKILPLMQVGPKKQLSCFRKFWHRCRKICWKSDSRCRELKHVV